MNYLDFEKPIEELQKQIDLVQADATGHASRKASKTAKKLGSVEDLEERKRETQQQIYSKLTTWQRIQVSRHPDRPYSLFYIESLCSKFIELYGDRHFRDDKAIVGGFGDLDGQTVMFIGHQKGNNTKMRQYRNFGMPNPEGYRKALRLMKLAEKFNKPIVTFIDTPGAYPGEEAEARGQGEAIARNLIEMVSLRVPVLCIVIGEGASGGALGIGIGDRLMMMENTWYSVISPESCSSILWRSWEHKEQAANALKPTPQDLIELGIIDSIILEPVGGAHADPQEAAKSLKQSIVSNLQALSAKDAATRINERIARYSRMGIFDTLTT